MKTADGIDVAALRYGLATAALAILALVLWSNRGSIVALFAPAFTATIEIRMPSDRDGPRFDRALAAAQAALAAGATLDVEIDPSAPRKRYGYVSAPSRSEARVDARPVADALAQAFDAEGAGKLDVYVPAHIEPASGPASVATLAILTYGAPALGLLAIILGWRGWRRMRAAGDIDLPEGAGFVVAGMTAFFAGFFLLPAWIFMACFAMAIPAGIAGVIVYKVRELQRTLTWPSAPGHIVKSETHATRVKQPDGSSTIVTAPDIEYAYTVDGVEHRGTRLGIGEIRPGSIEAEDALERYQVGRTGPVFYSPKNPGEAVLERDAPAGAAAMYAIAAGIVIVGLGIVIAFTRISDILDWLEPYFPPGGSVPLTLFFFACGLVGALSLKSSGAAARAAARWPTAAGKVLSSRVESRRILVPRGGNQTMEVWSPLVEYGYQIGGRDYHSARIAFSAASLAGAKSLAEATAARYPTGASVTVHYDPANPAQSTLETRVALAWPALVLTIGFFAGALFFSGWRGF
jgi:hypothetical protein